MTQFLMLTRMRGRGKARSRACAPADRSADTKAGKLQRLDGPGPPGSWILAPGSWLLRDEHALVSKQSPE
jgi:hypothetical protein